MQLTQQQVAFFEVFGYLVLPGLFSDSEIVEMSEDFDKTALDDRGGADFDADRRQNITLTETKGWHNIEVRDQLFSPLTQLFSSSDFVSIGKPGGGLYVGDTDWHPDCAFVGTQKRIKGAIYLDTVTKDTGCLRIVPGSHKNPLHDQLQPLRMGRIKKSLDDGSLMSNIAPAGESGRLELEQWQKYSGINMEDGNTIYGVNSLDIPAANMESNPGDVVFFDQHCFHAAFGGKDGRRMVAMSWASNPTEPGHVEGVNVLDMRK